MILNLKKIASLRSIEDSKQKESSLVDLNSCIQKYIIKGLFQKYIKTIQLAIEKINNGSNKLDKMQNKIGGGRGDSYKIICMQNENKKSENKKQAFQIHGLDYTCQYEYLYVVWSIIMRE